MEELDELKQLSPDERIKRLKEIERKKQNEVDEAKRLIQQSETEIIIDVTEKKQTPLDALKAMGMDALAGEEKEVYKIKHFEGPKQQENLEEITAEAQSIDEGSDQTQYQGQLAKQPMDNLYSATQDIYSAGPGNITKDQFYNAMDIKYAMQEKKEAIRSGSYSVDAFIDKEIDATMSMAEKIIDWYKG